MFSTHCSQILLYSVQINLNVYKTLRLSQLYIDLTDCQVVWFVASKCQGLIKRY